MRATARLLLACLLTSGCATTRYMSEDQMTEIISDPPGARIEINGNYVGDAPLKTKIECEGPGWVMTYASMGTAPGKGRIVASPAGAGCVQTKEINCKSVPQKVFFDTGVCRQQNIHITGDGLRN